jgi:hypothetical protein
MDYRWKYGIRQKLSYGTLTRDLNSYASSLPPVSAGDARTVAVHLLNEANLLVLAELSGNSLGPNAKIRAEGYVAAAKWILERWKEK